jgi:hypothetical protein
MSRRHRGRPHPYAPAGPEGSRRGTGADPGVARPPETTAHRTAAAAPPRVAGPLAEHRLAAPPADTAALPAARVAAPGPVLGAISALSDPEGGDNATRPGPPGAPPVSLGPTTTAAAPGQPANGDRTGQCTAPQLRRFIKSRPYVPMHELRRRFSINGEDDDVTPVRIDPGWIYVGLPNHEGRLLGDLLRTGEIGYELSLDPRTPIVIGVYPMRPIPRT